MTRSILLDDDGSQYSSVLGRLRRLEQGIPEDPRYVGAAGEPAFQNSWVNFDAAAPPVGRAAFFYRHGGRVYLGGIIKTGASGTTAFTLPSGYWPLAQTTSTELLASTVSGPAQVKISIVGGVAPFNLSGAAVSTWVSLEGLSFRHS